jgi:hypothetical protein
MVVVKFPTLLMPYNMKSAVNQSRKLTIAPILIPAPMVKELARLPMTRVRSAPYERAPRATAQNSCDSRATPVADPAFMA